MKSKQNKAKNFLNYGTIILISLFLLSITLELYYRYSTTHIVAQKIALGTVGRSSLLVKNTPKGKRLIPNAHVVIRNHHLSKRDIIMNINSLGFRGEEIPKLKKSNEFRILVLGDSLTWGAYLQEDEVYVKRIEKYLNKSIKNRTIRVINAGIVDIGLKEEMDILIEKGLSTQPDIVLVQFYLNDSRPPWGFLEEIAHKGWLRQHSVLAETIYRKWKLRNWLKKVGKDRFLWRKALRNKKLNWVNNKNTLLKLAKMAKYDWGAAWESDFWINLYPEFKKLHFLSKKHNFKVVIAVFPVSFQVYANFIENTPQKILKKKLTKFGFHYFDLLPTLRKHKHEDLFFDRCHPRIKTNDIIGKAIASFLEKRML